MAEISAKLVKELREQTGAGNGDPQSQGSDPQSARPVWRGCRHTGLAGAGFDCCLCGFGNAYRSCGADGVSALAQDRQVCDLCRARDDDPDYFDDTGDAL